MRARVSVETMPTRTPRVMQVESLFDAPTTEKLTRTWDVDIPLEEREWQIGLIVGPSGSGKSTVARELFGQTMATPEWDNSKCLLDGFPADMSVRDITGLLNAVGLSTVPAWLRPHSTLSTGEAFRADVARMLAESPSLAVVDEWTSTVDRQVAKVASAAVAKTVRRTGRKLVAVTCHYDVEDWLQPDWVYLPHANTFRWRSVQPRPEVPITIARVDRSAWRAFRHHHYLSGELHRGATCFGAFTEQGECVAFAAVTGIPHRSKQAQRIRRVRRLVVQPDWQGLGIGTRMEEYLAEHYCAAGYRFRSLVVHPGLVRYYLRSPRWHCTERPGQLSRASGKRADPSLAKHQADLRMLLIWGFEYVPKKRAASA